MSEQHFLRNKCTPDKTGSNGLNRQPVQLVSIGKLVCVVFVLLFTASSTRAGGEVPRGDDSTVGGTLLATSQGGDEDDGAAEGEPSSRPPTNKPILDADEDESDSDLDQDDGEKKEGKEQDPEKEAKIDQEIDELPDSLEKAKRLVQRERFDDGLAVLDRLTDMENQRASIHYWTGRAKEGLGLQEQAWREYHLAVVFQTGNRFYRSAYFRLSRELSGHPGTEEASGADGPAASTEAGTEDTYLSTVVFPSQVDGVGAEWNEWRDRAEDAMRSSESRLSAGIAQKLAASRKESPEALVFAVDASIDAGASEVARLLFDQIPDEYHAELQSLEFRLKAIEESASPYEPSGTRLERAKAALDRLFIKDAVELLRAARLETPRDPELLAHLAMAHALWGESHAAAAYLQEAASLDPKWTAWLEKPELMLQSPLRPPHRTVLKSGKKEDQPADESETATP